MTLSLKRVELSNIRSHVHTIFEPAEEGLTSIVGHNGAGKSTLVDSVAWALYGTKPPGVSKAIAIYRDGATYPEDKCFAKVDLEVDGVFYRVERRMVSKGGGVECEVTKRVDGDGDDEEWENVAGPAVTHAEPAIRKIMSMDEKGFLAAVLVQQKQVDQLISASPRERAQVIEKLTGISSVSAALTDARQEHNTLKKAVNFSTIDENELNVLKTQLGKLNEELVAKAEAHETSRRREAILKKDGFELKASIDAEIQLKNAYEAAATRTVSLTASLESKNEQLEGLMEEKNILREKIRGLSGGGNLEELEAKLSESTSIRKRLETDIIRLEARINEAKAQTEAHRRTLEDSFLETAEEATVAVEEAQATQIQAEEAEVKATSALAAIRSSLTNLASARAVISSGDGCPTCLQKVRDSAPALAALDKESARLEAEAQEQSKVAEVAKVTLAEARASLVLAAGAVTAHQALEALAKDMVTSSEELSPRQAEIKAVEVELRALEKLHRAAKGQEDTRQAYTTVLTKTQNLADQIETIKRELKELKSTASPHKPATLVRLQENFEKARNEYTILASRTVELRGDVTVLRERGKHLEEKIAFHEAAIAKHKELLKSVAVAASAAEVLDEFRSNRIEHSVPLIERYASDLLARFTEGKFTRLKLDNKFEATVVLANGVERAIGLLSGGELSAASMSLRLAISMLLNGGSSQNLIILDEVLVSQDFGRAELILQTIKDVCRGQVVLIAHNDAINDVADKTVVLGNDGS